MILQGPLSDQKPFQYDMIMADPPWLYELYSDKGAGKAPQAHYDCMPIEDIKALPVGHLAAKDCLLWLWTTHPLQKFAYDVCAAWGFRDVTGGVWVKREESGALCFGTGYRLRSASEPFIIATNGNPETVKNVRTVIEGVRRENSRKPEEAYAVAEAYVPGAAPFGGNRRLDLFSREERTGWDCWGDEAGKFNEGYMSENKTQEEPEPSPGLSEAPLFDVL